MGLSRTWRHWLGAALISASPVAAQQSPVVVELFTSQGCAACPPADQILQGLADREDVIALALHVDYWDYLGWADSFGQPVFSERQKSYAQARGRSSVFTPQKMIGGRDEVKGSALRQVEDTLRDHLQARSTAPEIMVTLNGAPGTEMQIELRAPGGLQRPTDVHLVRYKDAETVEIIAGENAGREITYRNIVTSWTVLGRWDGAAPFATRVMAEGSDTVVVIIQEQGYGPILAAARRR
ncbi:MAG: DUF1223 domain-containing protein [Roseinatronobacter sp.]